MISGKVAKHMASHDQYYLEAAPGCARELIDAETEWSYDPSSRTLHLKTRQDRHPALFRVQAHEEHSDLILMHRERMVVFEMITNSFSPECRRVCNPMPSPSPPLVT